MQLSPSAIAVTMYKGWRLGASTVVLLLALTAQPPAEAQSPFKRAEVAIAGGVAFGLPQGFAPCSNRTAPMAALKFSIRPVPFLGLGTSVTRYASPSSQGCGIGIPPVAPNESGSRVSIGRPHGLVGYQVHQAGVHITLSPFPYPKEELRVHGGIEYMWRAGLWIPSAGVSYLLGSGPVRFLAEANAAWYSTTLYRHTEQYEAGQLMSRTTVSESARTTATRLRLGVALRNR